MSDLQIVPVPTNPIQPNPPSTQGAPKKPPQIQDQLQASDPSIAPSSNDNWKLQLPTPSIISYMKGQSEATNNLKYVEYGVEQFKDKNLDKLFYANLTQAQAFLAYLNAANQLSNEILNIYTFEDQNVSNYNTTATSALNSYDFTADATQIANLNTYINEYNNGTIPLGDATTPGTYLYGVQQYQDYVASKQTAINTLNTSAPTPYNNNLTNGLDLNGLIAKYNADAAQANLGFPILQPIPTVPNGQYQLPSAPSGTPPNIPTLTAPSQTLAPQPNLFNPLSPPEFVIRLLVQLLSVATGFIQLFINFISLTDVLEAQANYLAFQQFYFHSDIPTLPPNYLTPASQQPPTGISSGVSLSSLSSGNDNPLTPGLIQRAITHAAQNLLDQPPPPHAVEKVTYLGLSLLAQSGLYAGSPALHLLLDKLPFINANSSPVAVSLGLSFANQIAFATAKGNLYDEVFAILKQENPSASADTLTSQATALTALLKGFLIQTAISVVGQTTNSPTLPAQLAATLHHENVQNAVQSAQQNNVNDVLNNAISVSFLKDEIKRQIINDGILQNEQQANNIAASAINDAIINEQITTTDQLNAAIKASFINSQIDATQAQSLADRAQTFVQAEISAGNLLDLSTQADIIQKDTLSSQTLTSNLAAQNVVNSNAAAGIISAALGSQQLQAEQTTQRQLRDRIAEELQKAQVPANQALTAATQTVIGTQNPNFVVPTTSLDELKTQFTAHVTDQLSPSIGDARSKDIADGLTKIVLGGEKNQADDRSLRTQLDQHIGTLNSQHETEISDAVTDNLRETLKPTLDTYTFNQKLLDPGNLYVLSMWGLIYQHHIPGMKQSSDIPV